MYEHRRQPVLPRRRFLRRCSLPSTPCSPGSCSWRPLHCSWHPWSTASCTFCTWTRRG